MFCRNDWEVVKIYQALIIDDEKMTRQSIITLGHWTDFGVGKVYEVDNGRDGLQLLRQYLPDIVLVDMDMPGINGAHFLEIAGQDYPDTKYIVIGGDDDYFENSKVSIQDKIISYLTKPVLEPELNEALFKAVGELDAAQKWQSKYWAI